MPIRTTAYREHLEGPIVGAAWGAAILVGLGVSLVVFWPVPVWAWVVGGLVAALFAVVFWQGVQELLTRRPKLIVNEAGIEDRRQPGGAVTLDWEEVTDIRGEMPAEGERPHSVPITVETDDGETVVDVGGLEQPADKVFKAIRKVWRAAQKEGRATAPPDTEAAEQEALASAEIPTLVVRNYRGNPAAALGCGAVAAGAVFGVLYALDANEVRYFCSGFVLFAAILFAAHLYRLARDRRIKLVIGPDGFEDRRPRPPRVVSLDGVRQLTVRLYKPHRLMLLLILEIGRTDGTTEEHTFGLDSFDHDVGVIVEHTREVWKMIRARELAAKRRHREE